MKRSTRFLLGFASAAVVGLSGESRTYASSPNVATDSAQQQLLDEVRSLRSEVDALKKQQAATTSTATTASSVPASAEIAAGSLAPASATLPDASLITNENTTREAVRSASQNRNGYYLFDSLDAFMSGYTGDRFTLQSTDGKFVFHPFLQLQFRDATNVREQFKVGGAEDTENGFEVRRVKVGFDGVLFSPDLKYAFVWGTTRANGTSTVTNGGKTVGTVSNSLGGVPVLEEGWVQYKLPDTHLYLKGGQIKDPIYHESIIGSRFEQAVERSLTADIFFNGDSYAEGITLSYDPKTWFRVDGGIDHGLRSANTNFLDYPNSNAFNVGVVGRAEFKMFGNWDDYRQMGAFGVKTPLLVAGVGGEASERGHANQTVAAADIMYADQHGLSLFGAVADRYTDHSFGIATASATGASITAAPVGIANTATNEYAVVGQAGYLLFNHLEPYGRFEYLHLAGTATGSHNYVPSISAGANYYFYGHRCKLTAQATYLPNGIPIDDTASDILASPGKHGEFLFDTQFQFFF